MEKALIYQFLVSRLIIKMKFKLFLIIAVIIALTSQLFSAPLFEADNTSQWAGDALKLLYEKQLIEGYSDNTFKGDRALSRFEMAIIIQRIYNFDMSETNKLCTKEDLTLLNTLSENLKTEISSLGVNISNLEKQALELSIKVSNKEKITFYGTFMSRAVSQGKNYLENNVNSPTAIDFSNGRPLFDGCHLSSLMKLGLLLKETNDITGRLEFASWWQAGEELVGTYWGLTPPYLQNPITTNLLPSESGIKIVFNRLWLEQKSTGNRLKIGSFYPQYFQRAFLFGQKNPNAFGPDPYPMFGLNFSKIYLPKDYIFEGFYTKMHQDSNYETPLLGLSYIKGFKFFGGGGNITINGFTINNQEVTNGISQGSSLIQLPTLMPSPGLIAWNDARTNTLRNFIGPQSEKLLGTSIRLNPSDNFLINVYYGTSIYNPDTTLNSFNTTTNGSMFSASLKTILKDCDLNLEYLSTSPAYDAFMLKYTNTVEIPLFLPYSSFYPQYYQMHDHQTYPNNREGYRFSVGKAFNTFSMQLKINYLRQVEPSSFQQFIIPGNIEPLFPQLQGNGAEKGDISDYSLSFEKTISDKSGMRINFSKYKTYRGTSFINDDVDSQCSIAFVGLNHKINEKFSISGNYNYITGSGHSANMSVINYIQCVAALTLNYGVISSDSLLNGENGTDFYGFKLGIKNISLDDKALNVKWNAWQFGLDFSTQF